MPTGGIEKQDRYSLLLKIDRKIYRPRLYFKLKTSNMNQLRTFAYAIALGCLVGIGFDWQARTTVAATEGTLKLVANGEDFVRQGFTSKDGWEINFDRLWVNLGETTAYSTPSSFEPQKGDTKESIESQNQVDFEGQIIDLAAGEADAEPITVAEATASEDFYNALVWGLNTAESDSPIAGNTIVMQGQATKDGETVDFELGIDRPIDYVCGEFVGDERLGIVEANDPGQVEVTFHFDHLFGDADTPPDDALNQDALGFQPIAELASNGTVNLDESELASQLSEQDYQKLTEAIAGLGHVGEGHCVIDNS